MIWEYNANDYMKIDNVLCNNKKIDDADSIERKVFEKALEKCQNEINNNSSVIVNVREDGRNIRNSNKFLLLCNLGQEKQLNGIAGRVSVLVSAGEIEELKEDVKVIINIVSRFDKSLDRPYFLLKMLSSARVIPNDYLLPSKEEDLFDFLLYYNFKHSFTEAYSQGVFKKYKRFEKNDLAIKGNIDFARHICENVITNNFSAAYSYRENTVDNEVNHLIVYTYHYIRRNNASLFNRIFEQDYGFISSIKNLEYQLKSFDVRGLARIINATSTPISHPLFQSYEKLRVICRRILRDEYYSFFGDDFNNEVSGVLYYLPDLWEQELEHEFKQCGIKIGKQDKFKWLFEPEELKNNFLTAIPDIVLYNNSDKPIVVADAKFKPVWSSDFWRRYNENYKEKYDGYKNCRHYEYDKQTIDNDINKLLRDMMVTGVDTGVIIAPSNSEDSGCYSYSVSSGGTNRLLRLIIKIPEATKPFYEWISEYDENIKKVITKFKEDIRNGKTKL